MLPLTRSFLVGSWFTVAALAQQTAGAAPFDPGIVREVRDVLDRAYASRSPPDLRAWYGDLVSDQAWARKHAGAFLHALLVTNDADGHTGYLSPRLIPSFRSRPPQWLGNAWEGMAETLAATSGSDRGAAVEAVAAWLLHNTSRVDDRVQAMRTIVRIETAGADALIREVVQGPHPTFCVVALGLQAAAARGMKDLLPAITSLRRHYHREVQAAAEAAAAALGSTGPVAPATTLELPPSLVRWLAFAADLAAEPVPASAKWCRVTVSPDAARPWLPPTLQGFLLGPRPGRPRVLVLPWGRHFQLDTVKADMAPASLAEYAMELVRLRERYDAADGNERRDLEKQVGTAEFTHAIATGWGGSTAEILVAAWSLERGDAATAARLLLPLLAKASDEREFFTRLLGPVAQDLEGATLVAFAHARDYPRALALAQKLAQPECADWWSTHEWVRPLVEQLPGRLGEFRDLRLPMPAEWVALKAKLSRREQVLFFRDRLRLLNCMANHTIDFAEPQYAEPLRMMDWQNPERMTRVVNPFTELLAMQLLPEEIELLVPLLASTDFVPAFEMRKEPLLGQSKLDGRWRHCSLHRLQLVAASLIETAAGEELLDPRRMESRADVPQQVEIVRAWCRKAAGNLPADGLAARLASEPDQDAWWKTFWNLHRLDATRAAVVAEQLGRSHRDRATDMARLLVLLDPRERVGAARLWRASNDPALAFCGTVLEAAADASDSGALRDLLTVLAKADTRQVHAALPALTRSRLPAARAFLVDCLQGRGPREFEATMEFAQQLMRAGWFEAYEAIDATIAGAEGSHLRGPDRDSPFEELLFLDEIRWWRTRQWLPGEEDRSMPTDALRADLRAWLATEWERIRSGKPARMRAARLDLEWRGLREPESRSWRWR